MLVNMKQILGNAQAGKYGVGFFNAVNVEMARAVIETAEALNAPVIVGTAQVLLPAMSLERVAEYLIPMAKKAKVPVCVHFDHGLTFEMCMEALKLGFTSIMYDCSTDPYEENVAKVAQMVKICHAMGATVEGELGHVGNNGGSAGETDPTAFLTDVSQAGDFVGRTGVPLVLHGGSGLSDGDFRTAVRDGVCMVNIFTDLDKAGRAGIQEGLAAGEQTMMGLMPYEIAAMKKVVEEKITLFGSVRKA